jgi:ribosome-associated translation inhibitor RaiA
MTKACVKMHRKHLPLAVKLNVIRCIEAGECHFDVYQALDLVGSTVDSVLKNKDKIKECGRWQLL